MKPIQVGDTIWHHYFDYVKSGVVVKIEPSSFGEGVIYVLDYMGDPLHLSDNFILHTNEAIEEWLEDQIHSCKYALKSLRGGEIGYKNEEDEEHG